MKNINALVALLAVDSAFVKNLKLCVAAIALGLLCLAIHLAKSGY